VFELINFDFQGDFMGSVQTIGLPTKFIQDQIKDAFPYSPEFMRWLHLKNLFVMFNNPTGQMVCFSNKPKRIRIGGVD